MALSRKNVPPTKVFPRFAVNKSILKPCLTAAMGGQYVYVGFSRCNKILCCSTYTISEQTFWFRNLDYNPDQVQKLISSSMSRHLSTCNISSKSMHAFFSNLANRQTDRHGWKHLPPPLSEVTRRNDWASRRANACRDVPLALWSTHSHNKFGHSLCIITLCSHIWKFS